ncbi:DNA polymerase III subunit gamma/tau [Mycoplasma sp. 2261]
MITKKYLALYRQYRPKTFEEICGQQHIVETLKNIIHENKIGHAYLFCGPHGNGKTSTAKIFANAINCIHRSSESPCLECIKSIDNNIDIIEIDAASNTGIEDIRELKEKIKHLPTNGKYKIYIIDEVHMLSKAAFNALLKTLEEPPKHAIFILATTDPQKIPLTILSRVQRFNFKKIDKKVLFNQLVNIFKRENIVAKDDAIKLIVDLGNGSFRDTLSIADQVAIYCANEEITKEAIERLFGIVDFQNIWYLIKCICANEHKSLIDKFNYLVENGASIEKIVLQIFKAFKDYIIMKKTHDESLLEFANKQQLSELDIDDEALFKYIELIQSAIRDSKNSDIPKELIDLYLLKMSSYKKNNLNDVIIKKNIEDNNFSFNNKEKVHQDNLNNDFQLVDDEIANNDNHKQFNSIFDLKSISNQFEAPNEISTQSIKKELKDVGIEEINVDQLLEKTSEILTVETAKEYENSDLLNDIISAEYNDLAPSKTVEILKAELDQDEVNSLVFIYQYVRMKIYNYDSKAKTDIDTMYYNMIERRIKKELGYLIPLLTDFKIFYSIDDLIVLKSEDIARVHQLNLKRTSPDFIEAVNSIFGRYTNVVAITRNQLDNAIKYCKENWASKKGEEIKIINLPNLDKYKNKQNPNVEFAKKLFGDIVKT